MRMPSRREVELKDMVDGHSESTAGAKVKAHIVKWAKSEVTAGKIG